MEKYLLRGRTLISAVLLFTLLPIYSFGEICELKCRALVMSTPMAMSAMHPGSTHRVGGINQHEHHPHIRQSTVNSGAALAAEMPKQRAISQDCCDTARSARLESCLVENQSVLLEPTKSKAFDNNPALLWIHGSIHPATPQVLIGLNAPRILNRDESASSFTLRI